MGLCTGTVLFILVLLLLAGAISFTITIGG
jgi:hypothetical protein